MMERFPTPNFEKKDTPSVEGGELSAHELADAMRAANSEKGYVEVGAINTEELREALAGALKNPVQL